MKQMSHFQYKIDDCKHAEQYLYIHAQFRHGNLSISIVSTRPIVTSIAAEAEYTYL